MRPIRSGIGSIGTRSRGGPETPLRRFVLGVPWGVGAPVTVALDPETELLLSAYLAGGGRLGAVFWVEVAAPGGAGVEATPPVLGRHEWGEGCLQFRPVFPFEAGLAYRASFDAGALQGCIGSDLRTAEFSLPEHVAVEPTVVSQIYPSGDLLPENLLRFYIRFSQPMARGRAGDAISICGADGETVEDVLYRAPVELWDASMQVLTVLLDPGRLKRGVGPHRALGPPLAAGGRYVLRVGAGMTDRQGRALGEGAGKRFIVSEAVRQPVAIEAWSLTAPASGGLEALSITFPRALDWALVVPLHCGFDARGAGGGGPGGDRSMRATVALHPN